MPISQAITPPHNLRDTCKTRARTIITFLLLSTAFFAFAQEICDSVAINFRQSKIELDTTYMNNEASLLGMRRRMRLYTHPDSLYSLTGISVVGAASPEGSVKFNQWLSERRAEKIFDYMLGLTNLPREKTAFKFLGRDWGGLLRQVKLDSRVPYRDEVIDLLSDIANSYRGGSEKESARNLERLKQLRGGVPYRYLYDNIFPGLRQSHLLVHYTRPVVEEKPQQIREVLVVEPDTVVVCEEVTVRDTVVIHDTIYVERIVYYCPPCKPFYMGVKTNMLMDAAAIPNIGVEFYLGKNISIAARWWYAWYKSDPRHRYWRTYGGDIEARWWFGSAAHEKPLTGHHLGLMAGIATYDFEWGGKGYMGGVPGGSLWDKANYLAGVEYGYSLPVARRLNIDFALALGYFGGEYRTYTPQKDCYVWQTTNSRHYFGPVKAEISLVWLIGCKNTNRNYGRKGGRGK